MKKHEKNAEFAAEVGVAVDEITAEHANRFESPKPTQTVALPGEIEKTRPQES